jgi:hypothetical protein
LREYSEQSYESLEQKRKKLENALNEDLFALQEKYKDNTSKLQTEENKLYDRFQKDVSLLEQNYQESIEAQVKATMQKEKEILEEAKED